MRYHLPNVIFINADGRHSLLCIVLFCRNECDPDGTGSLDREAFVRGMARIDEELRRAQLLGRARAPPPVPSRPILR